MTRLYNIYDAMGLYGTKDELGIQIHGFRMEGKYYLTENAEFLIQNPQFHLMAGAIMNHKYEEAISLGEEVLSYE